MCMWQIHVTAPHPLCLHMHSLCCWPSWRGAKSLLVTNTAVQNTTESQQARGEPNSLPTNFFPRSDTDIPLLSYCLLPLDVSPPHAFFPIETPTHFL